MAILDDIYVHYQMENRGLGSKLLEEVTARCKARGHAGTEGGLSRRDSDHFGKLKCFYQKHGFTVTFHSPEHPGYDPEWPGEIRLEF